MSTPSTTSAVSATEIAPTPPVLQHVWASTLPELSRPVTPARTPRPQLLALNDEVCRELRFEPEELRTPPGLLFLTGERRAQESVPVAQVYAGHQWGEYKPILGDGRSALLGERRDRHGVLRDIHVKGIGPTSMSRVDGFAVTGPMLREFLLSEALHALGVPTTRALAVIATGAPRDHEGRVLPGAVLARTATSHVRFGTFEYAGALGDPALLHRLAHHVIARHFPLAAESAEPYLALLAQIVDAVASVTADWMSNGFVHGVLSTDNVLVSAETIDYGPCAFLDEYEPGASFSSIDRFGRYAYDRQPSIMRWNLERLGKAMALLLADDAAAGERMAEEVVSRFDERYRAHWTEAFRAKLGLESNISASLVADLADDALDVLARRHVDFTCFWRDLARAAEGDESPLRSRFLGPVPELDVWVTRWRALEPNVARIRAANPVYIPRNHIVDDVLLRATDGDLAPFEQLLELLRDPYTDRGPAYARFASPAPAGTPKHITFCGT